MRNLLTIAPYGMIWYYVGREGMGMESDGLMKLFDTLAIVFVVCALAFLVVAIIFYMKKKTKVFLFIVAVVLFCMAFISMHLSEQIRLKEMVRKAAYDSILPDIKEATENVVNDLEVIASTVPDVQNTNILPPGTKEEVEVTSGPIFDYLSGEYSKITITEVRRESGVVFPRVYFLIEEETKYDSIKRFFSIVDSIRESGNDIFLEAEYPKVLLNLDSSIDDPLLYVELSRDRNGAYVLSEIWDSFLDDTWKEALDAFLSQYDIETEAIRSSLN